MASTFELICHHTYSGFGGLPVDLSDHDNHGQAIDTTFSPNGIAPGSGALSFHNAGRVHIPVGPVWQTLGGLKIEVTARLNGYRSLPRVLIRGGFNSFILCVWNRELIASYQTTKPTWPGSNNERIGAITDPIQDPAYRVPFDKWVTFGFMHDGLDTMELYADEQLVARRTGLLAGVPGVGSQGVLIGTGGNYTDHVLDGDIDEIKVWRLNPHIMDEQFFSRPVDKAVANCWERFFRTLAEALDRHPDCAQLIGGAINDVLDRLRRTIIATGPETRERFEKTSQEYLQLWRAGKLDSPEMEKLFADWCTWLRLVDVSIEDDPALQDLHRSDCLKQVLAECEPLDCDPQLAALVQLITRNCHQGRATPA